MTTYAINGLGRIGKLALRPLVESGAKIAFLNDAVGDPEMHAHLMEFDTVHGRWDAEFSYDEDTISINGTTLPLCNTRNLEELPLNGVDVVIDCTGAFKTEAKLAPYFKAGVKKVVVSAPVKDGNAANIVYGVNNHDYDASTQNIITAASCTTNCLAPVVKVIHENLGIKHGSITSIHDVTNTQTIVDRPAKDLRRARSALNSLIPTTTGSATAIMLIYPELTGKLNGHAVRVPLLNASITDCVFEVERATSEAEVNALFKAASEGELAGILGYDPAPKVSIDFNHTPESSIFAPDQTKVVGGTTVRVLSWYDNEWGFSVRMADLAFKMGQLQ